MTIGLDPSGSPHGSFRCEATGHSCLPAGEDEGGGSVAPLGLGLISGRNPGSRPGLPSVAPPALERDSGYGQGGGACLLRGRQSARRVRLTNPQDTPPRIRHSALLLFADGGGPPFQGSGVVWWGVTAGRCPGLAWAAPSGRWGRDCRGWERSARNRQLEPRISPIARISRNLALHGHTPAR